MKITMYGIRSCHDCVDAEKLLNEKGISFDYYDFATDAEPGYKGIEEGAWACDRPYGVVHRAASAGLKPGAGSAILRWALRQAGYLRIDTHPDNTVMQGLLKKLGFTQRGIIHVSEDNDPRYAFDLTWPEEQP